MWYYKITSDLSLIPDMVKYYDDKLIQAKDDVKIQGSLEQSVANLPGLTEQYFTYLQEIESILNYLNLQLRKIQQKFFQQYSESYNKALTSRDAEKYASAEEDVINYEMIIGEVALIRNKYLSIMKGLESKNYMLSNITKLRCAGLENVSVNEHQQKTRSS